MKASLPRAALLLAGAVLWCCGLLAARMAQTGVRTYGFLIWNLFLALIPVGLGAVIATQRSRGRIAALGFLWLLFFPNAPYLVTDLIHLEPRPGAPLWFDLLLLSTCAGTGLAIGFYSLLQLHVLFVERGRGRLGWFFALSVLFLSAFGIYLGRFLRWNSWDLLTRPGSLLLDIVQRLAAPMAHPQTWVFTLALGISLTLGYAFLFTLASPIRDPRAK